MVIYVAVKLIICRRLWRELEEKSGRRGRGVRRGARSAQGVSG